MHLMRFLQPEWNRLMAGSTHNTIYMPVFEGLQVLLPPNKEQRKIAAILCSLDEAIESTQAVINQLGVVKKAMMAELLTRGLPGRHSKFKMTEIGEVPEEWDVVPLRECLREPTRNGYSPVCPATPTGKWILHLGAVTFDGFNHQATKPAPLDDRKVDANVLELGDLVVSRSNTRERVGLAGLYRGAPSPCSYPDLLMRVRPAARLLPEFLESVLLSPRARSFFSSSARGTSESMVKINRDLLESLPVQVPPKDEQLAMSDALTLLADRRGAELIALAGMRGLRLALMSVLLTGEVRVKPDKEVA
jgi:type I restriction enzyme S subunit